MAAEAVAQAVPTFTTLLDISNMATAFRYDCRVLYTYAEDRMTRANNFIKIQDPAFPDDPTKRIWHPNLAMFYSEEQMVLIEQIYNQFVLEYNFWHQRVVVEADQTESLFNIQGKLDSLVASGITALKSA